MIIPINAFGKEALVDKTCAQYSSGCEFREPFALDSSDPLTAVFLVESYRDADEKGREKLMKALGTGSAPPWNHYWNAAPVRTHTRARAHTHTHRLLECTSCEKQ
jgi:hypothetical protein